MARGKKIKKRTITPDLVYENVLVAKLINYIMKKGKKTVARKIVYSSFDILKEKMKKEPVEVFDLAIKNASPVLEVKAKRVGGATYQIPREVRGDRKIALAMRWIIKAARAKKGKSMKESLAEEIMNAANNTGPAIKRKNDTHRMAEANRAFSRSSY